MDPRAGDSSAAEMGISSSGIEALLAFCGGDSMKASFTETGSSFAETGSSYPVGDDSLSPVSQAPLSEVPPQQLGSPDQGSFHRSLRRSLRSKAITNGCHVDETVKDGDGDTLMEHGAFELPRAPSPHSVENDETLDRRADLREINSNIGDIEIWMRDRFRGPETLAFNKLVLAELLEQDWKVLQKHRTENNVHGFRARLEAMRIGIDRW